MFWKHPLKIVNQIVGGAHFICIRFFFLSSCRPHALTITVLVDIQFFTGVHYILLSSSHMIIAYEDFCSQILTKQCIIPPSPKAAIVPCHELNYIIGNAVMMITPVHNFLPTCTICTHTAGIITFVISVSTLKKDVDDPPSRYLLIGC